MTTTVISSNVSFGQMTNGAVSRLLNLQLTLTRLQEAIATASSGYGGQPGTEFEDQSLFGVKADPASPGTQGQAYAYAVGQLYTQWQTFWTAATPYIEQLDNGQPGF